jgi:hypothetical protein
VKRRIAFSLASIVAGVVLAVIPVPAQAAGTDSAVTVSGKGEFANLKITVSQTTDLINQEITISWTGGKPTVDDSVWMDYLQIMQRWGDRPEGDLQADAADADHAGHRRVRAVPVGDRRGGRGCRRWSVLRRQHHQRDPVRADPPGPHRRGVFRGTDRQRGARPGLRRDRYRRGRYVNGRFG